MTRKRRLIFLAILTTCLTGCFLSGGTHGSIKSYIFSCRKDTLQNAIMNVIKNNPNIQRDTSLDYLGSSRLLDSIDCNNCPAGDNYYNDIKHYVTIKITSGREINEYTFRYYGPDNAWETAASSQIFICYAYDKDGNGGSEGNNGINQGTENLKKKLIDVFETELIEKVDQELKITHTEGD